MRVLITAGNTRERIDDVRDWGNIFTGNTGYGIAKAVAQVGEVDLLTSNAAHLAQLEGEQSTRHRITGSPFKTHEELRGALSALVARNRYDAVFMTAAVADYRPAGVYAVVERTADRSAAGLEHWVVRDVQAAKVKSSYPQVSILGKQTEKIVDLFRGEWGFKGLLVKFKLEVGISREELIRIGQASRKASGADYLVANSLDMVGGERAGAHLLSDAGEEWVPRAELPGRMRELVVQAFPPAAPK
jgi:phosphopantothenoylcysteine synthetase/decarboxylase